MPYKIGTDIEFEKQVAKTYERVKSKRVVIGAYKIGNTTLDKILKIHSSQS